MDLVVQILITLGCFMLVLASLGSLKFPDTLTRMAAVSKSSTLGSVIFCLAAALHFRDARLDVLLGAGAFILFMGIPISSHLLARHRTAHQNKAPLKLFRNDLEYPQKADKG